MSEDDRTTEAVVDAESETGERSGADAAGATADTDPEASADRAVESPTAAHDRRAEGFLELEGDLGSAATAEWGTVVDARRVDAGAVPAGYPLAGDPAEALALTVETDAGETTTYLPWPGDADEPTEDWRARDRARTEGEPVERLLSALDVRFGNLYGRRVPLARVDGHLRVDVPERPRGADLGTAVAVGQAANAVVLGLAGLALAVGGLPALPLAGLALVLAAGLGYATWRDAWYVRTHSDWDGGPAFWGALSALPGVNLLAGVAYLRRRARTTFLDGEDSLTDRLARGLGSLLP